MGVNIYSSLSPMCRYFLTHRESYIKEKLGWTPKKGLYRSFKQEDCLEHEKYMEEFYADQSPIEIDKELKFSGRHSLEHYAN